MHGEKASADKGCPEHKGTEDDQKGIIQPTQTFRRFEALHPCIPLVFMNPDVHLPC